MHNKASEKSIFIGPRKTGTSWLYNLIEGSTKAKEVRYPAYILRQFVYNRYVKDKSIIVWPYLIHEPSCLDALLKDLKKNNHSYKLYYSHREPEALISSMARFSVKYGMEAKRAARVARLEHGKLLERLQEISQQHDVTVIKLIDPTDDDLVRISKICDISNGRLEVEISKKVYVGDESSRIRSALLTSLFFRVKAFLPPGIQEITKNPAVRSIFFNKNR